MSRLYKHKKGVSDFDESFTRLWKLIRFSIHVQIYLKHVKIVSNYDGLVKVRVTNDVSKYVMVTDLVTDKFHVRVIHKPYKDSLNFKKII